MTPAQYQLCQLVHRCRYLPGSFAKRFARDVATLPHDAALTDKQATQLLRHAHRYRRQLHPLIERTIQNPSMQLSLKAMCWELV